MVMTDAPILYKYRGYSARSLEILVKREVYFASATQLNDPHDCRLSIRDALRAAVEEAEKNAKKSLSKKLTKFGELDELYRKMESDIASVGVLSLSRAAVDDSSSTLMWTHYADEHHGFCLGFSFSQAFLNHNPERAIIGSTDVIYKPVNPFYEYFLDLAQDSNVPEWNDFWTTILELGMRSKSTAWEHEKELRIIRGTPGAVPFTPKELSTVVFGNQMSTDNRATICALLGGPDWAHVRLQQARRKSNHEFGFEIVDV